MKTLKKITVLLITVFALSANLAFAQQTNTEKITNKVVQLTTVIELIQNNSDLRNILAPLVLDLVNELQNLLTIVENKNEDDVKEKKERVPYHLRNRPVVEVNGFDGFGESSAELEFIFTLKADTDTDIELNGKESFIFEIDGQKFNGDELDALAGYSLSIEDSSGDSVGTSYEIRDGSSEEITVTIIVDASETTMGTGKYEVELDQIDYVLVDSGTNSSLYVSVDSDSILLEA